jgi:16S rRNA (guanine966-N2)-methyltransferase
MRVVAGSLRGRRIESPPDHRARPTTDRVREAIFNALTSLDALVDASVLDLFAGTGALGIEALSRGAQHATFVETDGRMLGILRANLESLGLNDRSTVLPSRAEPALAGWAGGTTRFDLALLDPPYEFAAWEELLAALPADVAVIESDRPPELGDGWSVVRAKRYGGTLVTIVEPCPHRAGQPGWPPEERPDERRGEQ